MNYSSNQIGLTQATVYDISAADLAGANSGQRPDLLAKTQAIFRTPDGKTYSANATRSQLVAAAAPVVTGTTSNDDSAISLLSGGKTIQRFSANSLTPYNIAFFGDSRTNGFNGAQVECIGSGTLFTQYRTPMWVIAHMKDARYVQTYAISGGAASDWKDPARASGRTVAALNASNLDAVFVQFGINDIVSAAASAATVVASLQRLCLEIMKGGKHCVFEAINPLTTSFAGFATFQPVVDQANALMQAWLANFPMQAVYSDTASILKGADGYGNPVYYNADGIHFSRLGAYVAGKKLSEDCRSLLPKRNGAFFGGDATAPNLVSQTPGFPASAQFNGVEIGTGSVTQSSGQDAKGVYYEWIYTPTTLAGGFARVRCEVSVNFQTSLPPAYSAAIGEIVEGSAILVADDGANGPSSAIHIGLRQRFYTGSAFSDWGGNVNAAPTQIDSVLPEVMDVRAHTPRIQIAAASVVANPSTASGLQIQAIVETATVGQPIRVRMYNPQIRRVGYVTTPLSVTPPASASAYTNTSAGDQQVTIGGGTVTAIAINGVATGLVAGSFVLSKGDTLTPTYTVAPTMTVKQF
jgi:lysophospholipase L1-like esterase